MSDCEKNLRVQMSVPVRESSSLPSQLKGEYNVTVNYPLVLISGSLYVDQVGQSAKITSLGHQDTENDQNTRIKDFPCAVIESTLKEGDLKGDLESLHTLVEQGSGSEKQVNFSKQDPLVGETSDVAGKVAIGLVEDPQRSPSTGCEVQKEIQSAHRNVLCSSNPLGHTLCWPVLENGVTKMLVPLKEGRNEISFGDSKAGDIKHGLVVTYEPMKNKRYIRPVYVVCEDSSGMFEAPPGEDNTVESAKQRISFNTRILQTFTAENLNSHGFGRITFRLEENDDGTVKVNVFKSKLKLEKALSMTGPELYSHFQEELEESDLYDPLCKFWVFMSCTQYKPPDEGFDDSYSSIPKYVRGHTALGGGNMALFGTGGLHNWAQSLEEIVNRFTDCKRIDRNLFFDDSFRRGYYWANYATTLGASMHELGHTFNLPHTPSGIMGRGFDDMHKFFLSHKGAAAQGDSAASVLPGEPYKDGGAHWHRSSASILSCSRWIGNQLEDDTPVELPVPIIYLSENKRGPVGGNTDETAYCQRDIFDSFRWLKSENLKLKGFRLKVGKYIDAIQIIGSKSTEQESNETEAADVSSKWFGNAESDEDTHEFMLGRDGETLLSVDVRFGAWVDAIRFHSSHRSSVWFGGKGGNLCRLCFGDGNSFDGIFGTANESHVLSLGISRESGLEVKNDNSNNDNSNNSNNDEYCFFYSVYGIRVVELRRENGESMKHWEYLEGAPLKTVKILKSELLIEKASCIAVYDGCGECGVHNVDDLINLGSF